MENIVKKMTKMGGPGAAAGEGGSFKTIHEPHQVPPAEPEVNPLTLHYRAALSFIDTDSKTLRAHLRSPRDAFISVKQ